MNNLPNCVPEEREASREEAANCIQCDAEMWMSDSVDEDEPLCSNDCREEYSKYIKN